MLVETSAAQWLVTGALSGCGLACALGYLLREHRRERQRKAHGNTLLEAPRPWRRLGAAITALLAVMFFLGANLLSPKASPRAFALFWLLMLLTILWLCILAWVDIRHTRRLTSRRLARDYTETMPQPEENARDGE